MSSSKKSVRKFCRKQNGKKPRIVGTRPPPHPHVGKLKMFFSVIEIIRYGQLGR